MAAKTEESQKEGGTLALSPRFVADVMLGRLARWLRLLGYDVVYEHLADDVLIELLNREDRILLSRDRALVETVGDERAYFVRNQRVDRQVAEVVRRFGLDAEHFLFTRCTLCNTLVVPTTLEDVKEEVPPYVAETQREFWRCPGCGQVYWKGSHLGRARDWLQKALGGDRNGSDA
ncbi:MAG: hypothetical protein GXO73_06795 [Calditrichaeota bacterium]|nr:hypothetical protein [Calditrichota bacterium]